MFQILCLLLLASAAFALKRPTDRLHDVKHEMLKDLTETGSDRYLAESLIDIILDQGNTIKAMEKKMNIIFDQGSTVKQGWQNPGIYEYFPSRRELLVNPGIYLGNTNYSGKLNFHDIQKVFFSKLGLILCYTYFSINYCT